MNYYRRYIGDYAADTPELTLMQHGAYTLLLDAYYGAERPLPDSLELLFRICKATSVHERKAVTYIASKFFPTDGEFRRNARADRELAETIPILEKKREIARINGLKGGRPKKPTQDIIRNLSGLENKKLHQPTDNNKTPKQQHLGSLKDPRDLGHATLLRSLCSMARVSFPNAKAEMLLDQWARETLPPETLQAAISHARKSKPDPQIIPAAYLAGIVEDFKRGLIQPQYSTQDAIAIALRNVQASEAKETQALDEKALSLGMQRLSFEENHELEQRISAVLAMREASHPHRGTSA